MKKLFFYFLFIVNISFAQALHFPGASNIGPGFSPMQRGSVMDVTQPQYAEDIPGCVLALYAENYNYNSGGVATWTDVSGWGNHLSQSVELNKPDIETYAGITSVRTGPTAKWVRNSLPSGFTKDASGTTLVMAFVQRNTGVWGFAAYKQGADPGGVRYALAKGYFSKDHVSIGHGNGLDSKIEYPDISKTDAASFSVFGYVATNTTSYSSVAPVPSVSTTTFAASVSQFWYAPPVISVGIHSYAGAESAFQDQNFFSVHIWDRALSQSELNDAVTRVKAAVDRGSR
jgi:hypothetical protein